MDFQALDQLAQKLMKRRRAHLEREVGSIYDHGKRVANAVLALKARVLPNDDGRMDDVLRAAALFHDVGKGIEPHARYGAAIAHEALNGLVAEWERNEICRLIAAHCDRGEAAHGLDDYAKLLQDADLLDHFGVYGIWMCVQYRAHQGGGLHELEAFYDANFDASFAEYHVLLNYEAARRICADKERFERAFWQRLKIEAEGLYPDEATDHLSYQLGAADCFNEMVRAGVKRVALSHPCDSRAERDELLSRCAPICRRYGTRAYAEDQPLLTDLFPLRMNQAKFGIVFYRDPADLDAYLALKREKARLVAAGAYLGDARLAVARSFGALLSYSPAGIERLLRENDEREP